MKNVSGYIQFLAPLPNLQRLTVVCQQAQILL